MMWWGTKKQQFTLEPIRATLHHRLYVTVMNAPQDCVEHVLISNTQSNPPPQLIINHWHIWEQWLISLLNKRQNQSLYSSEPLHFFLAVLALPILWSLQVDSSGVCACVFVHFCVYVSGSNEAEDEADMKSIRRCQFGLILTLSCLYTLFSTHAHTHSHTLKVWMHQAYEYNHTHTQTHTPFPSTPTLSHWGLSNWGGHCQLTQFFYLPESG